MLYRTRQLTKEGVGTVCKEAESLRLKLEEPREKEPSLPILCSDKPASSVPCMKEMNIKETTGDYYEKCHELAGRLQINLLTNRS